MAERLTYTVEETARLLGISRGSAYAAVNAGEIPGVLRIGRRIVIARHALDELLGLTAAGPTPANGNGAAGSDAAAIKEKHEHQRQSKPT